jgi:hypothetical protein
MQTLNQLVTYLTEEKQNSDGAIREILRANHPIFAQLKKLLAVPYRVFFTNRKELNEWLRVRLFEEVDREQWDVPGVWEWMRNSKDGKFYELLMIRDKVFTDDGELVIYTAQQWDDEWVSISKRERNVEEPTLSRGITDDDVPF